MPSRRPEHGLGTLRFRVVESFSIVLGDLAVAGRYVDLHELALVFGAEPGADVALVDLPATQDDRLFRYARVRYAPIVCYQAAVEEPLVDPLTTKLGQS